MILIEMLIALAFIYLSAALFCSLVQEWIAAQTLARAKLMRGAIERMLGSDATLALYAHPVVDTASESHLRPPSYLKSAAFARAVLDGLRSPGNWSQPLTAAEVQKALGQIRHLPLRDALASLCGQAAGDMAVLEKGIAQWFDDTMACTTDWYKHHTRGILFGLGFVAAVMFNLDTFRMVSRIWADAAVRTELVAAAEQRVKDGIQNVTLDQAKATLTQLPFGWNAHVPHWPGWSRIFQLDAWTSNLGGLLHALVVGLPGWLVTALAVSLGAQFWFDLLKKVVDLRGTVRKPAPDPQAAK